MPDNWATDCKYKPYYSLIPHLSLTPGVHAHPPGVRVKITNTTHTSLIPQIAPITIFTLDYQSYTHSQNKSSPLYRFLPSWIPKFKIYLQPACLVVNNSPPLNPNMFVPVPSKCSSFHHYTTPRKFIGFDPFVYCLWTISLLFRDFSEVPFLYFTLLFFFFSLYTLRKKDAKRVLRLSRIWNPLWFLKEPLEVLKALWWTIIYIYIGSLCTL